jgi:hypothetical protein
VLRLDSHRDLKQLRSVTLRSDERDTLRVRQRFEQALAAVDWTHAGLPPQALLLVRKMVVNRSASRAVDDRAMGVQVAQALREYSRAARRPWLDPAAATAHAVWFSDEHELAACLVRDWLHGDLSSRWWWRTVLGTATPADWLREHVLRRGERVVAVLARLAEQGSAVAWLTRWDDRDVASALAIVARAYDAPLAVAQDPLSIDANRKHHRSARGQSARQRHEDITASTLARQRLARVVPEMIESRLQPAAVRLLAYALTAVREPGWLRTQAFSTAVAEWVAYTDTGEASFDAPASSMAPDAGPATMSTQQSQRVSGQSAQPDIGPQPSADVEKDRDRGQERRPPAAETRAATPLSALDIEHSNAHAERQHDGTKPSPGDGDMPTAASPAEDAPASAEASPEWTADTLEPQSETPSHRSIDDATLTMREANAKPLSEGEIDTAFGGLFYLLNAALALGLYGDFSAPRAPGLALSPWDWLALIGRRWFGREFERDPLWRLLATLAGRVPRDEPGADFDAPERWAISDAWLAPWSGDASVSTVHYRSTTGRLQLWHADGVVLFDVPRDLRRTPLAQAQRLCASRRLLRGARLQRLTRAPARLPARNARQRWLSWLLSYLQARLALALGSDTSAEDVAALLCRQPASVRWDTTTLQVRLSLATLPLPIRIAGLDRDPGWIPAAGRSLQFQFS